MFSSSLLKAQPSADAAAFGYSVVDKGAHHRVWSRSFWLTNQAGQALSFTNSFHELASGMHRWENGDWVEANPVIVAVSNGAVAMGAQHAAYFAANLNTRGSVRIRTPEGVWLKSHVLGLAYHDRNLRTNVLIAQLKDSFGLIVGSNKVVYGWDFYCGDTYLIAGECRVGSAYFEPGAILKFDSGGSLYVDGAFSYDGDYECSGNGCTSRRHVPIATQDHDW